jgi:Putative zinc-binding metallo-peptidase
MSFGAPFPATPPLSVPIRELGLSIEGSPIEPILQEFLSELQQAGVRRLSPDFYLSTEWGVPFPSISIGIPFYLARPELIEVHAGQGEYLEGVGKDELLRFLRHEMGHVVNYAYRLYEREDWVKRFGSMTQPYLEHYRPEPFSRRHLRHLPGWYAQKHPDEDWAETFAVWMTPDADWRAAYRESPEALAKLDYCDRVMRELAGRDPLTTTIDHDEDASELQSSLEEFYRKAVESGADPLPPGLDGALQAIFDDRSKRGDRPDRRPAEELIRRMERGLMTNVYTWTGHFPEETRRLVRHLARRAKELEQTYPARRELEVAIAFTTLVTSLAMNHVLRGHYLP